MSEAIDPHRADLRRRAGLGLRDAGAAIAVAIVAGLYRTRAPDDGTVIAYAGADAPSELADEVLSEAERLGITISESTAEEHWPEWAEEW